MSSLERIPSAEAGRRHVAPGRRSWCEVNGSGRSKTSEMPHGMASRRVSYVWNQNPSESRRAGETNRAKVNAVHTHTALDDWIPAVEDRVRDEDFEVVSLCADDYRLAGLVGTVSRRRSRHVGRARGGTRRR
uniref:Uncharacterized protein n=1 Tax=Mycena chlorophos TaxID=658473 RepID=A0ABQ0M0H7_MYCCL|nr:predicted protein [Mycena chlorophos]